MLLLIIIVVTVVTVTIIESATTPLTYFSNVMLTCTVNLTDEVNTTSTVIQWINPDSNQITAGIGSVALESNQTMYTTMGNVLYSLGLNFSRLEASHVGEYQCRQVLSNNDSVTLIKSFTVSVQGKYCH